MVRIKEQMALVVEIDLVAVDCGTCGVVFGLPDSFVRERRRDGGKFCCPVGHVLVYGGSEYDRLKQQVADAAARAERLEWDVTRLRAENDQARAAVAERDREAKRIERRLHAGVCPHCNRHFANVERHMKSMHSELPKGSKA